MFKLIPTILIAFIFAGCASNSPTTSPTKVPTFSANDYNFTGEPSSELTVTTDAPNWFVSTQISNEQQDCEGLKKAGYLFYDAQLRGGGFFGALQSMNFMKPSESLEITKKIPSNTIIQLHVYASTNGAYNARCGPIALKFFAAEKRRYKAHVGLAKGMCTLNVTDVTEVPASAVGASALNCK